MSTSFLIVNPSKRQFLDPARFGEAVGFSGLLRGEYCLGALKLLLADCFENPRSSFHGSWIGDPVIFASDSASPKMSDAVISHSEEAVQNLHELAASSFVNISYQGLAELCLSVEVATELVIKAKESSGFLRDLGATLEQYQPAPHDP